MVLKPVPKVRIFLYFFLNQSFRLKSLSKHFFLNVIASSQIKDLHETTKPVKTKSLDFKK